MRKDFYIFRHGQSSYNLKGLIQGHTNNSELTDIGKEQALDVGKRLKNKGVELIVSSPLRRALQTAEFANKSLNVPIQTDEHFIEVNVGDAEGMHYLEAQRTYSDIFDKLHSKTPGNDEICYPNGETRKQVRKRVFEGLDYWAAQNDINNIAISSHGIMLSQILINMGIETADIKNGAILHICKENNQWRIIEWL